MNEEFFDDELYKHINECSESYTEFERRKAKGEYYIRNDIINKILNFRGYLFRLLKKKVIEFEENEFNKFGSVELIGNYMVMTDTYGNTQRRLQTDHDRIMHSSYINRKEYQEKYFNEHWLTLFMKIKGKCDAAS